MGIYTSGSSFEALLSQVRQTGPHCFKLPRDITLTPLRSQFAAILKETKLDKYWHFSLRELPADREGGRELPTIFVGGKGDSNSIAP